MTDQLMRLDDKLPAGARVVVQSRKVLVFKPPRGLPQFLKATIKPGTFQRGDMIMRTFADAAIIKSGKDWRIVIPREGKRIKFLTTKESDLIRVLQAAESYLQDRQAAIFSVPKENRVSGARVDWVKQYRSEAEANQQLKKEQDQGKKPGF
ncbi:MAG TPA: hypothetical protein VN616_18400 [Puia sp.]|nr:hypothetical protein [Puia sp.]